MDKNCEQLFVMTLVFRIGDYGASLTQDYGARVAAVFAQSMSYLHEDVTYALAAFIDESILASQWSFRDSWQVNTLQQRYFHEQLAGEGFFKRLTVLRQHSQTNIDLLEVYYLCLQFGFRGFYLAQQGESLFLLQSELLKQISTINGAHDGCIFTSEVSHENRVQKIGRLVPIWVFGAVAAVVMFAIYLSFNLLIDHQTQNSIIRIKHYAKNNL